MGYAFGDMGFSQDELDVIDRAREVDIETHGATGSHRATVWAIVDRGAVFVRSYYGPRSRWYREALADPAVAIAVDGRRVPATASPATDPHSIERTSAGLSRKYAGDPATPRMNRAEVLDLTLRLDRA
jgi:hypothetical protein